MSSAVSNAMTSTNAKRQSFYEERANSLTHGVGAVCSVGALIVLTALAAMRGNAWHVVGCSVFGVTLVMLYLASTLYHSVSHPRTKAFFRTCDHSAIFLLIAGSYTPFLLVNLRGPWGWSLLGVVWGLALMGIAVQMFGTRKSEWLRVALYVVMGWVVVIAVRPLFAALPIHGILLLFLGGMAYTVGVVFFMWRSLPYHHAIWHLFVMAGSTFHFLAVLWFVLPQPLLVVSP